MITTTISLSESIPVGSYFLTVLCASGCKQTIPIDIGEPQPPTGYTKVLIFGNQITYADAYPSIGWTHNWGMSASAGNKDYKFLLTQRLAAADPTVSVKQLSDFPGLSATEGIYWEQNYWNYDLNRLNDVADWEADLIIIRIGENVDEAGLSTHQFIARYLNLINKLRANNPAAKVVVTNSVWYQPSLNSTISQIAGANNLMFVELSDMWNNPAYYSLNDFTDAGLKKTPNDSGHLEITNRLWSKISPETVAPSTPSLSGGYAEGTFSQLSAFAPFTPDNNQVSSWVANTVQYINNGTIKVGILNSIGGIVSHVSDMADNVNLINTYDLGGTNPNGPDTGRSLFMSMYGTPGTGYDGVTSTDDGKDTGMNPIQGGDYWLNRGVVTYFQKKTVSGKGEVLYTKGQGVIWFPSTSPTNIPKLVNVWFHVWWWIEGRSVRYFTIIENNRTDNQMSYEGREQEAPGCYTIAPMFEHQIYTGSAPFTSAAPQRIDNFVSGKSDTGEFYSSECWIGSEFNGQSKGIYLFTPYNSRFRGKQFGSTSGDANSNASSYVNAAVMMDFDNNSTFAYEGYLYVGSRSSFRSWLNTSNITLRPFKFDFRGGKHQGWYSVNARFKRESGEMVFHNGEPHTDNGVTTSQGKLISPSGAWPASSLNKIYINAKVSGVQKLTLRWLKSSQREGSTIQVDVGGGLLVDLDALFTQYKDFVVVGDGQSRTYELNLTGAPYWDGIISKVELTNPTTNYNWPLLSGSEKVVLNWINTQNTAP